VTGALDIRRATAADLLTVQEVMSAAYEKYLTYMDRPPAPMLRDYVPVIEAGALWVAGDPVAGVIALNLTGDTLLIENLAVRPASQGTGVGRALMDFAELRARQLEVRRLALYTHVVMTENQAIYQHLGYREVERKTVDGYHRVFMEKTLGS
jgi:N-acetylglutamate synthase-like GNAT family acetyltransferase